MKDIKINGVFLLDCAQRTSEYFCVKAALTGVPVDENGNISAQALLEKNKGTDAYDAIVRVCAENDIDLFGKDAEEHREPKEDRENARNRFTNL